MRRPPTLIASIISFSQFVAPYGVAYSLITVAVRDSSTDAPIYDATVSLRFEDNGEEQSLAFDRGKNYYVTAWHDAYLHRKARFAVTFAPASIKGRQQPKYKILDSTRVISFEGEQQPLIVIHAMPYPQFWAAYHVENARRALATREYDKGLGSVDAAIEALPSYDSFRLKEQILEEMLTPDPPPATVQKISDFVYDLRLAEYLDSGSSNRFKLLLNLATRIAALNSKDVGLLNAAASALDLAIATEPGDAKPYQVKYQMLEARGDTTSRIAAMDTIAKYFETNTSTSNEKTILAFVSEWLTNIELVGESDARATLPKLATVLRQHQQILKSGLGLKRYNAAKQLIKKTYG